MTGTVEIDGVTFQVNFKPNLAALVSERPEKIQEDPSSSTTSSDSSTDDYDVVVGDLKKTKKNRLGLSLPSKLKKKLKSRTNKKKKGKSKMASLLSAIEPSTALIQQWKASGSSYQDWEESSGSLFAGRLEEDTKEITLLPTIQESCELKQQEPSPRKKITQNQVVEEQTSSKKQLKQRLKRFLKKLKKSKKSKKSSSQSSVADTASTTSSPTRIHNMMMVDDSTSREDAMRDDTEVAPASVDETFFSVPSEPSLPSTTSTTPSDVVVLPPSLTLVRPSSVARQASCAANNNIVWNKNVCVVPQEDDDAYPSDEEDSSVDSIVSPVPSCPPAQLKGSPPRKKILNYKKPKATKKNKTVEKAPVVVMKPTVVAFRRWNVWALVLAATLCAISAVWQKCFNLPQEEVCEITTAALVNTGANISFVLQVQGESYYEMEDNEDSAWPFDECLLSETPVSSSFFDENGVLDCSYPTIYV